MGKAEIKIKPPYTMQTIETDTHILDFIRGEIEIKQEVTEGGIIIRLTQPIQTIRWEKPNTPTGGADE